MRTTGMLVIDQGTTNSKALLVSADGHLLARVSQALAPIATPQPGWFEQDGENLWQATMMAAANCLAKAADVSLAGLAITNQRESVIAWRRSTGQPLSPVLGWQDARTASLCDDLQGSAELIHQTSGLRLDPMFSAPKIAWLLGQLDSLDDVCIGTIDAYLVARLTGLALTEAGNASRTLLFDLRQLAWSAPLLDVFGLPISVLPQVMASNAGFGTVRHGSPIASGVPVVAIMGDSHSALYRYSLTSPGAAKVTYGTGSSVMTSVTDLKDMPQAISTTLAWLNASGQTPATPSYAHEGNIIATGAALDAIAGLLRVDLATLTSMAKTAQGQPSLTYVPAFSGLAAPYWDRSAVGALIGLSRNSTPAQMAQAGFDAVAQQVCDVIDAMADAGDSVNAVFADGGGSVNPDLMQLQADLLGVPVAVTGIAEASAMGVAQLAWQTVEPTTDLFEAPTPSTYHPQRDDVWRQAARDRWANAVARCRGGGEITGSQS